jgi:6-phosphogluconolactonase (cycloisomerase 2 family)
VLSTSLLVAGTALGAAVAGLTAAAADPPFTPPSGHALFVQTDAVSGNQIRVYQRGTDGTVSLAGTFATGGDGGVAAGASADPLASQGSLALTAGGQDLLAVNAGSNSVSVLAVHGTQLSLTDVVPSGGDFPVSITTRGSLVEVLNAGGAGSVAGFHLRHDQLVPVPGGAPSLGLANTDPPNFLAGAGEVAFTPAGDHVVVTTKGSTNSYEVFSVAGDVLGATPVVTPAATPVPFAFTFDANGHLVATEAAHSTVSTYTVNADGTLSLIGSVTDGQAALCWISLSNGVAYGSNTGSANVSSFAIATNGTPTLANAVAASTHAGTTDSVVDPTGSTLYVESGGAHALDVFHIGTDGGLAPVETVWNLPAGSEGLAVS